MLKFAHEFEETPRYGEISDELFETPAGARIAFSNADNGIWLAANPEGFLHLARIFAELGTRKLPDGYHFHRSDWLKPGQASDTATEVSVELLDG
jgi:hypothetical protein